jgi:hypothetical protein
MVSVTGKNNLKSLLLNYTYLFGGSMGDWKTDPVDLQLKSGEMQFELSLFPLPKRLKKIDRLCNL